MEEEKYPSRNLTYEWGRNAYERLADEVEKIDTKGLSIFSFGSVIISIAATTGIKLNWTIIPFALSLMSYLFLASQSIQAFGIKRVIVAENPSKLKEKYWRLQEDEAKNKYWESLEQSCNYNFYILEQKGKALDLAIRALGIETILLIAWLFLRSLC